MNVREAQRQAVRKYLPCRKATKKLRDFLVGDAPDHRNAVPATFFGDDGLMIPIKAQDWGVDDTLKLFRTPRVNYDRESCKLVPLSTTRSTKKGDIIEGRIFVSRRALESRLPSAGHPEPITRQHATIATERRCRRWLEQQMREGGPTKTKEQYLDGSARQVWRRPHGLQQADLGKCDHKHRGRPLEPTGTETEIEPGRSIYQIDRAAYFARNEALILRSHSQ